MFFLRERRTFCFFASMPYFAIAGEGVVWYTLRADDEKTQLQKISDMHRADCRGVGSCCLLVLYQ